MRKRGRYFSGLAGVVSADETCPVAVEKERLVFEIESFPDQSSEAEENRSGGSVTAEYTFYNPADYAVRARLLFPFGRLPSYAVRYDEQTGERNPLDDVERYKITAGGQPLETVLRHTYSGPEAEFDLEADLAKLQNGYAEDTFYRPDLEVVEYTYEISGVDRGRYPAAHAWFFLEADPDETDFRIWLDGGNGMSREKDRIGLNCFAENGNELRLYIIGEQPQQMPEWQIYAEGEDSEEIEGQVELTGREQMTFWDLALSEYAADSGISENDWYHAAVAYFHDCEVASGVLDFWLYGLDLSDLLMQWYEYEISIGPGERLVNTVTAPLYPDINRDSFPALYRYSYLLSPARTWESFGTLDVEIHTPYALQESQPEDFRQEKGGYGLELPGLPEGELEFVLYSAEKPAAESTADREQGFVFRLLPVCVCIAVGAAAVLLVFFRVRKSH